MADEDEKPATPACPAEGAAAERAPEASDVVVLGPRTADGAGVHVLRARQERLEAGELRCIEEGRPIQGEVVTLAPRANNPRVCDVKDSYLPPALPAARKKGPAQVATQAYRDNWDEVFARDPDERDGDRDLN